MAHRRRPRVATGKASGTAAATTTAASKGTACTATTATTAAAAAVAATGENTLSPEPAVLGPSVRVPRLYDGHRQAYLLRDNLGFLGVGCALDDGEPVLENLELLVGELGPLAPGEHGSGMLCVSGVCVWSESVNHAGSVWVKHNHT